MPREVKAEGVQEVVVDRVQDDQRVAMELSVPRAIPVATCVASDDSKKNRETRIAFG